MNIQTEHLDWHIQALYYHSRPTPSPRKHLVHPVFILEKGKTHKSIKENINLHIQSKDS